MLVLKIKIIEILKTEQARESYKDYLERYIYHASIGKQQLYHAYYQQYVENAES